MKVQEVLRKLNQMDDEVTLRLSQAFDDRDEQPAVECIARFVNINYGCNKELMENCKRLKEYAWFIQCVRNNLSVGYSQKQAVVKAVDECISQGILRDVLVKHRAEVFDMFLTKFDKKMYEEAIRQEGRDEIAEKYEELAKNYEEISQKQQHHDRECAERLRDSGVSYDIVRKSLPELSDEELNEIFGR